MILKRELGATITAIILLFAFMMAGTGCSYIHFGEDPTPIQPEEKIDQIQLMIMKAGGQMLMSVLMTEAPEQADMVAAYIHNTLYPKLDDPNAESIIKLTEEIVYGLHRILDNITMDEVWKTNIRMVINLMADILQPGVKINATQKALVKAFADGMIMAYNTL